MNKKNKKLLNILEKYLKHIICFIFSIRRKKNVFTLKCFDKIRLFFLLWIKLHTELTLEE